MLELHIAYHVAEALAIIYLIISQHQTKQMLVHLARTITSVNDHLDALVSLTRSEVEHEKKVAAEDFQVINEEESEIKR